MSNPIEEAQKREKRGNIGCGIFVLVFIALIVYCFGDSDKSQPQPQPAQQQVQEQAAAPPAEEKSQDDKVCNTAGLGDKAERWASDHELTKDNGMMKNYGKDNSLNVVFLDNVASTITFAASKDYKFNPLIKDMLPSDAVVEPSKPDDSDAMLTKSIAKGHSDKLAKVVPSSKGDFTIIEVYDKKSGKYLHTVVDCTPSIQ